MFLSDEEKPGGKNYSIKIPNLIISNYGLSKIKMDDGEEEKEEEKHNELSNLLLFRYYFKGYGTV